MQGLSYGIIGGSSGIGSWLLSYFKEIKYKVAYNDIIKNPDIKAHYFDNKKKLIEHCDVIIIAVPITEMTLVLEEIYDESLDGKIVIDLCSIKAFMVKKFNELKKKKKVSMEYHSIHPMFGPDVKGIKGQGFVLAYTNRKKSYFLKCLGDFFRKQGAHYFEIDYRTHDKVMATIQNLNHFNVFVSAKTLYSDGFKLEKYKGLSSPAYRIFLIIFTRYALHNPELYADIQIYNEEGIKVLKGFKREVNNLYKLVKAKDREGMIKYIEEMQPYFRKNEEDYENSRLLFHELSQILSTKE